MAGILNVVRTILIGGLWFLLPLGLVLLALEKLYKTVAPVGASLHAALFPSSVSIVGPVIFAILVLVAIAFLAGMFVRTRFGKGVFRRIEKATLGRIPLYSYLRPALNDFAGGAMSASDPEQNAVVEVRTDDSTQMGVLIETTTDNRAVVFLPDAPSALSGTVAIFAQDRVVATTMTRAALLLALRRYGTGIAGDRAAGASADDARQSRD